MLKCETTEQQMNRQMNEQSNEVEKLRETVRRLSIQPKQHEKTPSIDLIQQQSTTVEQQQTNECHLQSCVDRKRKLIDENDNLLKKVYIKFLKRNPFQIKKKSKQCHFIYIPHCRSLCTQ